MLRNLFVYGTLHPDRAPAEIAETVRQLVYVGDATVRGHLRQFGKPGRDYPGVVLDESGETIVGSVFLLPPSPDIFENLDAYEDFRPDDLPNSLFVRRETTVSMSDGSSSLCWVYEYNGNLPSA